MIEPIDVALAVLVVLGAVSRDRLEVLRQAVLSGMQKTHETSARSTHG